MLGLESAAGTNQTVALLIIIGGGFCILFPAIAAALFQMQSKYH